MEGTQYGQLKLLFGSLWASISAESLVLFPWLEIVGTWVSYRILDFEQFFISCKKNSACMAPFVIISVLISAS